MPSFNGAASARSRNLVELEREGWLLRGFNGAASARSRNYLQGPHGELGVMRLQWGRERALAELQSPAAVLRHRPVLQWGRERALAELKQIQTHLEIASKLQWGRERALAELGKMKLIFVEILKASMGPRARARGIEIWQRRQGFYRRLQWGRERALAELP